MGYVEVETRLRYWVSRVFRPMSRTRKIRGLVRFRVPSYLDGVAAAIDLLGQSSRESSGPSLVARPVRTKALKPLSVERKVSRYSLESDARKIGNDMTRALKANAGSIEAR